MDNIIEVRKDRVVVELDGVYMEKPIITLEMQKQRKKMDEINRVITEDVKEDTFEV
jgi:hypothetical protein